MTPKCYSYIRFSTPEQSKGDSIRRQLKMGAEYAKEKGLVLDENLKFRDEGLSAFKGAHRSRESALGKFLALVKANSIPNGSTLIVESLDRLSREEVLNALEQFIAIIRAGVTVVTLADRMEYSVESVNSNIGQLMFSLTIMARAHEESQTKSRRLRAAWDDKRENIHTQKLTSVCPEWLKINADHTAFHIIEERAEIVRGIYRDKLAGIGSSTIVQKLNQQQRVWLPKSRKREKSPAGWQESYVLKILGNRAVIGEYQPHKLLYEEGRRVRKPIGEPIKDYFPAVVPPDLFHAVQQQLEQNRSRPGNGGGRTGRINNLFGHIARCGYCESPMTYTSKSAGVERAYLVCDAARRKIRCKSYRIRYDELEKMVLTYCRNLDPADLLPGREEHELELKALQGRRIALQGEMKGTAGNIANLADSIASTNNTAVRRVLEDRLAAAIFQQESLQAESQHMEQQISHHAIRREDTQARLESLSELLDFLRERSGEELIEVRRRLRQELRALIDRIDVYPVGQKQMTPERAKGILAAVLDVYPQTDTDQLEQMEAAMMAQIDNRDLRRYTVHFKGGSFRVIEPATPHKLTYDFDEKGKRLTYQGLDGEVLEWP